MKIKVCGLKFPKNIFEIDQMNFDYMGFIFFSGSPRFVGQSLDVEQIKELKTQTCGVFVNEKASVVLNIVNHYQLNAVQLHGNESPEYVSKLTEFTKVIKVIHVNERLSQFNFDTYKDVSYFLFETSGKDLGGTGISFQHEMLNQLNINKPFFISGGIHHQTFDKNKIIHPNFAGLDVNSKYESAPGLKNIQKLNQLHQKYKTTYVTE